MLPLGRRLVCQALAPASIPRTIPRYKLASHAASMCSTAQKETDAPKEVEETPFTDNGLKEGSSEGGEGQTTQDADGLGEKLQLGEGWSLFPEHVVEHLDKFVIGQDDAKKATAIALRTRWRRMQLDEEFSKEVKPSNIMLKGPTGSGKTEIARRLSSLANAPFVKVEATRYTEVGFHGADTSQMIKQLVATAFQMEKELARKTVVKAAREKAEDKVLELLHLPKTAQFKERLRSGQLDHQKVTFDVKTDQGRGSTSLFGDERFEILSSLGLRGQKEVKQTLPVQKAIDRLVDDCADELLNEDEIAERAKEKAQQFGIVFIDEIDKLCRPDDLKGSMKQKGEGVQRELLTLVEGATVSTKIGPVNTDHILFIASGAFHQSSPSDLLPELQGRFPVRVELKPLQKADLVRIVSEKKYNLIEQTTKLLKTEGVELDFTASGIDAIADFSARINKQNQDIGARRLNTVIHRVIEDLSYKAPNLRGTKVLIDAKFVGERLQQFDPLKQSDLSKYIL